MYSFWRSIFVAIALKLLFNLVVTVKERSLEISELLIGIIDTRDPNLNGHSRYVQNLTMLIYKYLPVQMKSKINEVSLEYAALMHDIGKLGIPESILNKSDKLNEDEWKIMKKHPQIAIQILKPLKNFSGISEWILYHHERIDGKGYYSIPGDKIPLAARIISVADTYSAITMRRSYKEPQSYERAIDIIKECAGTQLDTDIVKIFCTIPKEEVVSCAPKTVDIRVQC